MSDRFTYLYEHRDNAQSQLDVLMGECPDVCAELVDRIAAYNRIIARAEAGEE